jgi:ubiquinone/menaquinone biosynthesis C-methylase UbiE
MKQPSIRRVGKCRACQKSDLQRFLHLPQMPFTDDFIPPARFGQEFRADIDIFVCLDCFTAQTQHDVDVGDYYEDYQYSVGGSATAGRFMRILAENLQTTYYPGMKGKKVLEVGSGDGEQLLAFKETGCRVLGYEPSSSLCQVAEAKGIPTIQGLFTTESIRQLPENFREVDVVMLSYTFDHLPDPRAFIAAARSILNQTDGLLVVEIHDLEKIIQRQEYCLFEHEHSIYLTEATARQMCRMEGMEIINFNLVPEKDRRANSLIFVATPKQSRFASRAVEPGTPADFSNLSFYEQVGANIQKGITNLEAFVTKVTGQGKRLAGYGAGGRGVMTLAAMTNASKLCYLVDKKPKRPGLLVPKSGIPLVAIDALKSDPVDEILVFSFGYMQEIQNEVGALGYKPGQFHSLLDILSGRF